MVLLSLPQCVAGLLSAARRAERGASAGGRAPRRTRPALAVGLVVAATLLQPLGAKAQLRAPLGASNGGWAPVLIGVHAGRDNALHYNVLGAQLRIPVLPSGRIELTPNMDVTFARGSKEYQYNFEAVYVTGGDGGGLYAGGGIGMRRARFGGDPSAPLETVHGYSAVLGLKITGLGRAVPQVEWRWVWVNKEGINPQQVTIGLNLALWD